MTEAGTELTNAYVDRLTFDRSTKWKDIKYNIIDAAILGAVTGGGLKGVEAGDLKQPAHPGGLWQVAGSTVFVFNEDESVTIMENGVVNQLRIGTIRFDPANKQMIWIHKQCNHGPLKAPFVLEGDKLFYKNPEGFMVYFERTE